MKKGAGYVVATLCVLGMVGVSAAENTSSQASLMKDKQGWINADQLKLDIGKVIALPKGDYDCDIGEGSDDSEDESISFRSKKERIAFELARKRAAKKIDLQIKQCEATRKRESDAYNRAINELNVTWLPVLQNAVAHGDPVAEVFLRLCETTSTLNRDGIATDCSESESDRNQAQLRLEAINFKPALYKYAKTSNADAYLHCIARDMSCFTESQIERHKRILDVMRTGYFGVAEDFNTCQLHSENEELDRRMEECQRLGWLMRVVNSRITRGYVLSLEYEGKIGDRNLNHIPRQITRDYRIGFHDVEFRDPNFQSKFWKDVKVFLSEINANIENDLRRDSRWGVFLSD